MAKFLQTLICASEKAANIARSCVGTDGVNDDLLVAEKSDSEANSRFDKDYKTIADVLAQETARATIIEAFPEMSDHVRGEECSEIGGKRIKLLDTEVETAELLQSLVTTQLAAAMAKAAHSDIHKANLCPIPNDMPNLDATDLSVWIDPIDATAEFIAGVQGKAKPGEGLECVTVLIGAYKQSTGEPVAGVINQPFYKNGKGRVLWGLCYNETREWGGTDIQATSTDNIVLMSNGEDTDTKQKIKDSSFDVKTAPGAGNKLMKVALGEATAYVLSRGTTFLWDTCAPHAILKARGGDVISYKSHEPIKYDIAVGEPTYKYCNSDGIIAYSGDLLLEEFLTILQ